MTYNPALEFLQTAMLSYVALGALSTVVLPAPITVWRIARWFRHSALLVAVLLCSTYVFAAPQSSGGGTATAAVSEEFWRWVVTQGGLTIVVLVLGWAYRRDLLGVLEQRDKHADALLKVATESTASIHTTRDAILRLATAIESQPCIARRRHMLDDANEEIV